MKFAVEHTVKAIEYFEKWFNYKYQLPKLDIVSIPNFRSGAMENWGLITFRENYILLYNDYSDLAKIIILEVIYHEIAHQWFGNLVTLDSWSQLWLNEFE
jgi:aminopeptidase N